MDQVQNQLTAANFYEAPTNTAQQSARKPANGGFRGRNNSMTAIRKTMLGLISGERAIDSKVNDKNQMHGSHSMVILQQ